MGHCRAAPRSSCFRLAVGVSRPPAHPGGPPPTALPLLIPRLASQDLLFTSSRKPEHCPSPARLPASPRGHVREPEPSPSTRVSQCSEHFQPGRPAQKLWGVGAGALEAPRGVFGVKGPDCPLRRQGTGMREWDLQLSPGSDAGCGHLQPPPPRPMSSMSVLMSKVGLPT